MLDFPRTRLTALQELASRLHDSRKVGTELGALARDLLGGFHDICMHAGLDQLLAELEQTFAPLDSSDRSALADHEVVFAALVAQIKAIDLDGGGPRNAKPRQLADCVVAALTLKVIDEPDRTLALPDTVRNEVVAALASVADVELAVPRIRETIIAQARSACEERYLGSFDKIAAQLDDRGMRMVKQPKVPIDAMHAIQHVLFETRNAILERIARAAIDRAKEVIARANADAAARIDQPITLKLTPRDIAILRVCDQRVPKQPAAVVGALLDALCDGARLAWQVPERPVRAYAANQTFAVGDLLEHPKFGRGSVVSCLAQRIEVEFADGKHTLVHVRPNK
jgi:hypothetical protein